MVLILPLGLCAAISIAIWAPATGAFFNNLGLVPGLVVLIFLISGLQTRARSLRPEPRFGRTLLVAGLISLLLAPLLGWLLFRYGDLPEQLALGLLVIALVPPTLSSCVVLTAASGGKSHWALFMTLGLNLSGILSVPLLLSMLLDHAGGFSPLQLLWKLITIVLLPFLAGLLLRPLCLRWTKTRWLGQLPTLCVILTVWMTLSASQEVLSQLSLQELFWVALLVTLLHTLLLLCCLGASRLLGLTPAEGYALLFTASQKTLPVAVSVLVGLGGTAGVAVISCILFHFVQLLLDSMLVVPLKSYLKRTTPLSNSL